MGQVILLQFFEGKEGETTLKLTGKEKSKQAKLHTGTFGETIK
jgi:hypothetical protein